MEEFRTLVADILSGTIAADQLSKKAFREIEEAFVSNADKLFHAKQREYYREDIYSILEEDEEEITSEEEGRVLDYLECKYDSNISYWDNIRNAIDYHR